MLDRKLKVLIVTEDDPLYVIRFFDVFFEEYPRDKIEISAITIDNAFHEPLWKTASCLIRFYGPMNFVRLLGRFVQAKLTRRSIARLARQEGIAELPCTSINDPAYVAKVRSLNPDIIMSVCAPEIFKKSGIRDHKSSRHMLVRAGNGTAVAAIPLLIGCIFFADDFIKLWMGPEYHESAVVMQILAASAY